VVEKEDSIQVMRYAGDWKDVGTWNMMAEVMADTTKGNATLDETCVNTHVVNELDIPVLCMGCKNMIVAVSGDGILVSDKEQSGYMKPYVDKIRTEVHFAEKSWGTYTVIDAQPGSVTAKLFLKQGSKLEYHSHEHREESWNIIFGIGRVIIDGIEQSVKAGDVIKIPIESKHTLIAETDMKVIEVQVGSEISRMDKKFERQ
jgi:mannose-1-phosphate guanylyltransferase